jgi:very-short-patch-repair endonuclease
MDFLMLLRNDARIVIEMDGKHHYADDDGKASPERYAGMVSADRDLRLRGYEVYRFGGKEMCDKDAAATIQSFFERLFSLHGVR